MKKKGLLFSALLFTFLLLFTGCGKKKAITAEDFKDKAEAEGLTVQDVKSQFENAEFINQAYVASSKDGYKIEFYVLSNKDDAKSMFEASKVLIENAGGKNKMKTEVNLSNYNKYSISTSTTYGYICRIDNTLVYVYASKDHKDDIKDFIKKIKY